MPDRAHVLRRGPHSDRPADDPRGEGGRSPESPRGAAAHAARRLLRRVQGDARLSGHDPHDRPASPRVPAEARGSDGGHRAARGQRAEGARAGREADAAATGRAAPRVQPDARPSGRPSRHHVSGNHRDADARHHRSRVPPEQRGDEGGAGNHDSARRPGERAEGSEGDRRSRRERRDEGTARPDPVPRRHDDRSAARRGDGR